MLSLDVEVDIISTNRCYAIDNVCHGRESVESDFFYVYTCFITNLHIYFSLDDFTMDVLHMLNVTPM